MFLFYEIFKPLPQRPMPYAIICPFSISSFMVSSETKIREKKRRFTKTHVYEKSQALLRCSGFHCRFSQHTTFSPLWTNDAVYNKLISYCRSYCTHNITSAIRDKFIVINLRLQLYLFRLCASNFAI